jgi:hypothetical protein
MKPRVTLRRALEDPELLGTALEGPSWHPWRSLLLAALGAPFIFYPRVSSQLQFRALDRLGGENRGLREPAVLAN